MLDPVPPWLRRRGQGHEAPAWLRDGGHYLLTVCTVPRHVNQLASCDVAPSLWDALCHYHDHGAWHLDTVVVMPDHVHVLAEVPVSTNLPRTVADWKRYLARRHGMRWQRDFFDYRLRATDSLAQKRAYLRDNPQAAGLVADTSDWPWCWTLASPR